MKRLLIFYSFVLVTIMTVIGFTSAKSIPELISAVMFFPLALYFGILIVPKRNKAIVFPVKVDAKNDDQTHYKTIERKHLKENIEKEDLGKKDPGGFDLDRRKFLKIVGTAGISLFLFSLFTKKAHGAFFGSMPGPGTVSIKDSSGTVIDPATSTPTDGYKISEVDDSSPAYYGFIHKNGTWFIMKETSGAYRYVKGNSSFSTSWTGRAGLTYNYFNVIFG